MHPDHLLVSSDISASKKLIILDDTRYGHKSVIAKVTLTQQQRVLYPYTRTSWNFKKANWRSLTDMLEITYTKKEKTYHNTQMKLANLLMASLLIALKFASQ